MSCSDGARAAVPVAVPAPPVWLLAAMPALGTFAASIYLPSIPAMAADLAVPVGQIQMTVTVYLAAMASCMLLVGPLSDRLGRRRVALVTLFVFLLGSIASLLSTQITVLFVARMVQGLGASGGIVLGRAMLRDGFAETDGVQAVQVAKASANMSMSVSVAPMLAPLLGGYLQQHFGWRANMLVIVLLAAALTGLALRRLPETLPPQRRRSMPVVHLLHAYGRLLVTRRFMAFALPVALGAAALFAYQTEAPVLLIGLMHLPPAEYGYYGALPSLGFFTGSFIVTRTAHRVHPQRMIGVGCSLLFVAGLVMLLLALGLPPAPLAVAGPMLLFGLGNGMLLPSASVGGLGADPGLIGTAAALSGAMRMGIGSLGALLVATLPGSSAAGLGGLVALIGAAAWVSWQGLSRHLHSRPR